LITYKSKHLNEVFAFARDVGYFACCETCSYSL